MTHLDRAKAPGLNDRKRVHTIHWHKGVSLHLAVDNAEKSCGLRPRAVDGL